MIGIIVLNYNTYDETVRCIESIYKFTSNVESSRIYIVDNASPDGSGERLMEHYQSSDVKVICANMNLGFSGGNNLGIKEALRDGCSNLFLLNSDVELLNDAVTIMSGYMGRHEEISVVGPHIVDARGEYSQVARKGLRFSDIFFTKKRYYPYDRKAVFTFDGMSYGCCFGIKASFIEKYGLLDDHIFLYCEEDIIAHLLKKDQSKACILPDAKVMHLEGASSGKNSPEAIARGRYFRWESELYVLKEYAHSTDFQLWIVRAYRNLIVLIMRIAHPEQYPKYI